MDNDFFLYDSERLHKLANTDLIQQGLTYFSDNRVFDLEELSEQLTAQVEDAEDDQPYWLALTHEQEELVVNCDCHSDNSVCRHAIAVLYAYAAQLADENSATLLGSAVDEAIQQRIKKGRNEVQVKLLKGNLGFGTWQASSLVSATHWKTAYQVQIRSLDQQMNYCNCPDLASNRLGTCKHIEAVLHYASKQTDYQALKNAGCPISFIYLAWESATRPMIRLHRQADISADLALLCDEFFNQDDIFNGRLPEDIFRLSERIYAREDCQLGDDVAQYARQCADDAAQVLRGQTIEQDILRTHGVLPGINAKLFPYQSEGVAFLASRGRALLADDMGLGKTLQAIAAASWLAEHEGVQRVLILCPASLKHQWAREIEKFTAHSVQIIQGGPENRLVQYRADALFFIINYELVLRDLSVIRETLKADLVILDEAQRIKNWRTKLASTVKLIQSRYVFVLSGTPLENRLEDLYSLLQVVDSRVLGPLWRCLLDFHISDERGKVIGYRNLSELRRRIAPVMLRRNRALVSDQLPDRTEVSLDIAMTDVQLELHDSALSNAGRLASIAKRRLLTPGEQNKMMAALQQARMACNAAGLVDKETQGSPKLDELARLLEELCLNTSRKAVVFSQWALMTKMVESLVRSMGLGCVRLHGGVPSQQRGALMEQFQHDDAVQVFISTDAGGTGLNLQSASILINLDMPWNPAILDQRIARIHRLGQQQKVQIFLLLAEDSYEQRVAQLVKGKRDLFDNVVSPDASEDVVGISKKMLETLIEDLAPESKLVKAAEQLEQLEQPEITQEPSEIDTSRNQPSPTQQASEDNDSTLRELIVVIQSVFTTRIEQILGTGGGLLVVVEQMLTTDERNAEDLSLPELPVAVIEACSLRSLQRLGAGSPVAEAKTLFAADQANDNIKHPFLQMAEEKLHSAEVLLQQHCTAGVMDLLSSALLLKVAGLNSQAQIPTIDTAVVWLYNEILPAQVLSVEQVNVIVKIISLHQSTAVPATMIELSLIDVQLLFADLA